MYKNGVLLTIRLDASHRQLPPETDISVAKLNDRLWSEAAATR
ncbi:hypothetical protein [Sphingobium sp. SYK-6]|nr:hypothetical protein [Sphingobium sp. SYK-6]